MSVVKTVQSTQAPSLSGDQVTFAIAAGNSTAATTSFSGFTLTDTYDPNQLQFVSATPAPDTISPGTLTWNFTGTYGVGM